MGALLTVHDVRHRRGGREVLVIGELEIQPGERLGVLGPNGAGKTTLLRLLAGLETPTRGEVRMTGAADPVARRRRVAYAAQRPALMTMSVQRNVELPLRFRGVPRAERRPAARAALARLGIEQLADRPAGALSHGEAQRVSLARALVSDPEALLLDEPAAALDATARAEFLADLDAALAADPRTVVHVSHHPSDLLGRSDRILALLDGRVTQLAPPRELLAHPATATLARLVGYENVLAAERTATAAIQVNGRPVGIRSPGAPGSVELAAWGSAIRLVPTHETPVAGIITGARLAPGHWEISVDIGQPVTAHGDLAQRPPAPGTRVGVRFEPSLTTVIDKPAGSASARSLRDPRGALR